MSDSGDYKLANNITIFSPRTGIFSGIFDGQDNFITAECTTDINCTSLFTSLNEATIKNFIIQNFTHNKCQRAMVYAVIV